MTSPTIELIGQMVSLTGVQTDKGPAIHNTVLGLKTKCTEHAQFALGHSIKNYLDPCQSPLDSDEFFFSLQKLLL